MLFQHITVLKAAVLIILFNFKVSAIVMDNDTTTIARLRATVDPDILKMTDQNHTKKSIGSTLIEMSDKHKILRSHKTRGYFIRNIMYALGQNQGDEEGIRGRLKEIVPHAYGMYKMY